MNPLPYQSMPSPSWVPIPLLPPASTTFWGTRNVYDRLRDLQETVGLAKTMQKELEFLTMIKDGKGSAGDADIEARGTSFFRFSKHFEDNKIDLESQESLSVEAANTLISKLRVQLEPFRIATDDTGPWEEKSAVVRLANKIQKSKRNKSWRKRKRRRIAGMLTKELERFDQADQEADEWRAREIAKDIAKRKVEKMKEIAKLKAKEERKRLESELELVLIVEKLHELRSIRIDKLKKQGYFLPEEDDKFLERVRAAVEEEERLAMVAVDTDAAKDAIATAEESRKVIQGHGPDTKDQSSDKDENKENRDPINEGENIIKKEPSTAAVTNHESVKQGSEGQGYGGTYDSMPSLPAEFYHYYHGSSTDMGTLIEVRRTWDAYIRPGGSRIPGHWVQPPPPADEIWASYLVRPK